MITAITGTPGVGKTEACRVLRSKGYKVLSLVELAEREGCIDGKEGGELIIDVSTLCERFEPERYKNTIVEGHLSHFLKPLDVVIVLRCRPSVLQERLRKRKYPPEIVRENMEAEAVDLITIECVGMHERVCEVDTTSLTPEETANAIIKIMSGNFKGYEVGRVDWSEEVLGWY